MKRLFYASLGLGAGVVAGVYLVRKIERTQRKLTPDGIAANAGARVGSLGERVRSALADGRAVAAAREAELRALYREKGREGVATATGRASEWVSTDRDDV